MNRPSLHEDPFRKVNAVCTSIANDVKHDIQHPETYCENNYQTNTIATKRQKWKNQNDAK